MTMAGGMEVASALGGATEVIGKQTAFTAAVTKAFGAGQPSHEMHPGQPLHDAVRGGEVYASRSEFATKFVASALPLASGYVVVDNMLAGVAHREQQEADAARAQALQQSSPQVDKQEYEAARHQQHEANIARDAAVKASQSTPKRKM